MPVRVELSLLLRKYVQDYDSDEGIVIEHGGGKSVREIIDEVGVPPEKVFQVFVNRLPSHSGYVAKDGDLVTLAMIMGAG